MSVKNEKELKKLIDEAIKQGKMVIVRGRNESRVKVTASDPNKIVVIIRD